MQAPRQSPPPWPPESRPKSREGARPPDPPGSWRRSEIEDAAPAATTGGAGPAVAEGAGQEGEEEEALKDDVYTGAAYGDLEKLHRLVEREGRSVTVPDALGYHALQWAALNNRVATAQYILEVGPPSPSSMPDAVACCLLGLAALLIMAITCW